MKIEKYIHDARVIKVINDAKKHFEEHPLNISDIKDSEGNQYVDLVQEGGGILGIGLIGYTYALEELGVRFYSLGGTSAGSINAALLAAIDIPKNKKSERILEILESLNLMSFIDGGSDAITIVKAISKDKGLGSLFLTALNQIDDFVIRKELGVNRGEKFHQWLVDTFDALGVKSTSDILSKMNNHCKGLTCEDGIIEPPKAELAIIASDITTQTKVDFPRMSDLYFVDPDSVNPAYFVRASMSIPVFFDPLTIECLPNSKEQVEKWQSIEKAYFFGNIPEKVTLVDGGILSNFPIDIFHITEKEPSKPTFGVKLGYDRVSEKSNKSVIDIIWNSFSAARQMRDHEFIMKNQDFINLITHVDDSDIDWLNFNLSDEDKIELFIRGVEAACTFIKEFNWPGYKRLRQKILDSKEEEHFQIVQAKHAQNFIRKMK